MSNLNENTKVSAPETRVPRDYAGVTTSDRTFAPETRTGLQSVTDQHYNGHDIQIDYFDLYAWIWVDGKKITRVTAPESPLDWAHAYVDKHVALMAAKLPAPETPQPSSDVPDDGPDGYELPDGTETPHGSAEEALRVHADALATALHGLLSGTATAEDYEAGDAALAAYEGGKQ